MQFRYFRVQKPLKDHLLLSEKQPNFDITSGDLVVSLVLYFSVAMNCDRSMVPETFKC